MHVNSGYLKEAVPVIANHVAAFDTEDYDVAVAPSGSCVASVKHQHPMVARALYKSVHVGQEIPPQLYRAVAEVLAYVYEVMERKVR